MMVCRLLLGIYELLGCAIIAVLLCSGLPLRAFAYIDPSVMTYAIQAIAGVAVALSAVFGVFWRRGKKRLQKLLDIDTDAKREHEGDVHRVTPGVVHDEATVLLSSGEGEAALRSESSDGASADPTAKHSGTTPEKPSSKRGFLDKRSYELPWRTRLALSALTAFFFVFTVFFVAPLEIVAGSASSLVYGLDELWWVVLLPDIGMFLAIAFILSAVRGRAFFVLLALLWALGLCAYVQALVLNGGLPAADGATIHWGDYMKQQIISGILWGVIIIGAVLLCLHNRQRFQGIVILCSTFLVIVQAVGLVSLSIQPALQTSTMDDPLDIPATVQDKRPGFGKAVMTEGGLYEVHPQNNIIVFVLDTFDDAYLKRIERQEPDLFAEFTGFTSYPNCTSAMIPTRFAVPYMLTGEMPTFDESFAEYKEERYARGSFLGTLDQAGYSVGIYTDSMTTSTLPQEEQDAIAAQTVNIHALSGDAIDYGSALYSLYQMGLYRDMMWPLKWGFWYYTDQINTSIVSYDPNAAPEDTVYVMDDVRYYDRLRDLGLTIDEQCERGPAGTFRFIHLLSSHYPFTYDEEVNEVGEGSSNVFSQSRGALHIVSEYLRQMKELGLYDQATIIVTADHGYWTITEDPIEDTSTPIMLVKPRESAQEAAKPLVVDAEKPVSHLDLQATILDAMGLDPSLYAQRPEGYEGYSMLRPIPADRLRLYLTTDSLEDLTETWFREYAIQGNALDLSNWHETGRRIDAQG